MATQLQDLCPYKSLVLTELKPTAKSKDPVDEIIDDIAHVLDLDGGSQDLRLVSRLKAQRTGRLQAGFLHFTQTQLASWTKNPNVLDVINHLALICRFKDLVAIYLSEPGLRNRIVARFEDGDGAGLSMLQRIPRARLNAAFLQGEARTLWLSGVHRRTSVKADSKILSGIDLRAALNPLDDQTYDFTAARCLATIAQHQSPVGIAPRRSRVWFGLSKNWGDFEVATTNLLEHLDNTTTQNLAPFPVIATPVMDGSKVKNAFDVSFMPPELTTDDVVAHPHVAALEKWAYGADFVVTTSAGSNFSAILSLKQKVIGTIDFTVDLADPENVVIEVAGTAADTADDDALQEALKLCKSSDWITIRYDSGHTVSDGTIKELRHRDIPFGGFQWVDFGKFDVAAEKPDPLSAVGQQDSLFCWVQRNWPIRGADQPAGGWLVCDDGAMEIADFIHLDVKSATPILSLIHVKGAGNADPQRSISVSKYEVVTGQAVKNLRFLDRALVEDGLVAGIEKKISKLVWKDGKVSNREAMLKDLKKVGANFKRRVVIVQPHVTESSHQHAQLNPKSPAAARLRQLDTLLIGAEINCRALGADFAVIAAKC